MVDVGAVLSLFGFSDAPPAGLPATAEDGIPHFLSPDAGPLLARLSGTFKCRWCTGWEERAEEHLSRLLGLPDGWPHLPFIKFDEEPARHRKLGAIESAAGPDRPVAWIDVAFAWAVARPGSTLLVPTEPATGLRVGHVTRLESRAR